MNKDILFQFFHWYFTPDQNLWCFFADQVDHLANCGVTHVWLPPAYKSAKGINEPGYAVYDLYDLGEFNQKETVRTRWGTKEEYINAIQAAHEKNIKVIADVVLNHKLGADAYEEIEVIKVENENRHNPIESQATIKAPTKFTFPGRNKQYSNFQWDINSFTGICMGDDIYLIKNQFTIDGWDQVPDNENGNYDFLMGNDIEFRNPAIREELKNWGKWYVNHTNVDGFRLDGLKHITHNFFPEWIDSLNQQFSKEFYVIGEYWKNNNEDLLSYLDNCQNKIKLFDVPLHYNLHEASLQKHKYDLREIFSNTVVSARPDMAITFVDNHDTQPLQSLESTVQEWFKPAAYALILLRNKGIPCVFYPAIYGADYFDCDKDGNDCHITLNPLPVVELMMQLRREKLNADQTDFFDDPNIIGWTNKTPDTGYAVLISNGTPGELKMSFDSSWKNSRFDDITGQIKEPVFLDENGEAVFKVSDYCLSVWVKSDN